MRMMILAVLICLLLIGVGIAVPDSTVMGPYTFDLGLAKDDYRATLKDPIKKEALIIVDMQTDFSETGSLPVKGASEIVPLINTIMKNFSLRIASKDSHPLSHNSFKEQGGKWPRHCVAWTKGWDFIPGLDSGMLEKLIEKATDPNEDAYSAFEGTNLEQKLRTLGVTDVFICGLATDYCVKGTALDANRIGFNTSVIIDACKAVNETTGQNAIDEMEQAGITMVKSYSLKNMT